ncbi:hypothetical protein D3C72_1502680 [compost metagenome]
MFISDACSFEFSFEFFFVDFFEDIFETTIVFFQDRIFSRKVQRPFLSQRLVEARMSKTADRFIRVVHCQCNAITFEVVNFVSDCVATVFRLESDRQFAFTFSHEICCTVLVTECVTADTDWCSPVRNKTWNVFADDGFTENCTIQDITDSAVW